MRNGEILEWNDTTRLMETAVIEAAGVAEAKGIDIGEDDPVGMAALVCRRTAGNVSSMLQDVRAHRRTEVERINGAVVAGGLECGIPTPVNETLYLLVKGLERSYT